MNVKFNHIEGKYDALNIANFIIVHNFELGCPVSNFRLQMFLYFVLIEYRAATGRWLFGDDVRVMGFGPAVLEVYRSFCAHAGTPINPSKSLGYYKYDIDQYDKDIISKILDHYEQYKTGELSAMSKNHGWQIANARGGMKAFILFEYLILDETRCYR